MWAIWARACQLGLFMTSVIVVPISLSQFKRVSVRLDLHVSRKNSGHVIVLSLGPLGSGCRDWSHGSDSWCNSLQKENLPFGGLVVSARSISYLVMLNILMFVFGVISESVQAKSHDQFARNITSKCKVSKVLSRKPIRCIGTDYAPYWLLAKPNRCSTSPVLATASDTAVVAKCSAIAPFRSLQDSELRVGSQ